MGAISAGQVWVPKSPRAKPRRVIWVGRDDCYGHDAVRWSNDPGPSASTMQGKAFRWWIAKHKATLLEISK